MPSISLPRPAINHARREWMGALLTIFLGLGVLGAIAGIIYLAYKYIPKGGDGTLVLEVNDAVQGKYQQSAEVRVYDSNNNLKKSLRSIERKLDKLPIGTYRVELSGVEGLALVVGDGFKERSTGRSVEVQIEAGATTIIKVVDAASIRKFQDIKLPDLKLPDPKDKETKAGGK